MSVAASCDASNQAKTSLAGNATPVYKYKVINRYAHDPAAFTQGLLVDQGRLYESTGLLGQSSLREVDLASGRITRMVKLPQRVFGEGLVLWKDKLIQLTWRSGTAFVFDKKTFQFIKQHKYTTEGWGITHDNTYLIMSDGSSQLYFRDPDTFEVKRKLEVTDQGKAIDKLNELEYINGAIYANIWQSERIAIISPATGKVSAWLDLTGIDRSMNRKSRPQDNVLNGIAYDKENHRLFVTGKRWPVMYEIEVVP